MNVTAADEGRGLVQWRLSSRLDSRHTYACTRLLEEYREGKDVNALLPALATYLGHVNVSATQVYLHATAALLDQANQRFAVHFHQHIRPMGG